MSLIDDVLPLLLMLFAARRLALVDATGKLRQNLDLLRDPVPFVEICAAMRLSFSVHDFCRSFISSTMRCCSAMSASCSWRRPWSTWRASSMAWRLDMRGTSSCSCCWSGGSSSTSLGGDRVGSVFAFLAGLYSST
ncbi:hypothetical protein B0H63DRAFT_468321 [Podospora didyma]|uniref:Secreted protein n=1 Tax=Podospora didyma TaxID=330526 RepID=A0AAE0NSK4_9PEZI|nr:hypothetical protein B0H63DRAFT_468321 [Podospora didyma]